MKKIDQLITNSLIKLFSLDDELSDNLNNSKLIFPKKIEPKRSPIKRISEQEARFIFCNEVELNGSNIYYSIETPTINKFSFTGKKSISGNIDVCIYKLIQNKYVRSNNIEFKAHNMAKSFAQDFIKLLMENGEMNYFIHILQSVNNYTLYSKNPKKNSGMPVINKYIRDINELKNKVDSRDTKITIFIISLFPKLIIKKAFNPYKMNIGHEEFSLDYNIINNKIEIKNLNWENCYDI